MRVHSYITPAHAKPATQAAAAASSSDFQAVLEGAAGPSAKSNAAAPTPSAPAAARTLESASGTQCMPKQEKSLNATASSPFEPSEPKAASVSSAAGEKPPLSAASSTKPDVSGDDTELGAPTHAASLLADAGDQARLLLLHSATSEIGATDLTRKQHSETASVQHREATLQSAITMPGALAQTLPAAETVVVPAGAVPSHAASMPSKPDAKTGLKPSHEGLLVAGKVTAPLGAAIARKGEPGVPSAVTASSATGVNRQTARATDPSTGVSESSAVAAGDELQAPAETAFLKVHDDKTTLGMSQSPQESAVIFHSALQSGTATAPDAASVAAPRAEGAHEQPIANLSTELLTGHAPASAAAAATRESVAAGVNRAFDLMDAAVPHGVITSRADARRLEVGLLADSLGWVEVRAATDSLGHVSASLHGESAAAAQSLHQHADSISAYVNQHASAAGQISVTVSTGDGGRRGGGHAEDSIRGHSDRAAPAHTHPEPQFLDEATPSSLISIRA